MTLKGTGDGGGVRRLPKRKLNEEPRPAPVPTSSAPAADLYFQNLPEPEVTPEQFSELKQPRHEAVSEWRSESLQQDPAMFFRRSSTTLLELAQTDEPFPPAPVFSRDTRTTPPANPSSAKLSKAARQAQEPARDALLVPERSAPSFQATQATDSAAFDATESRTSADLPVANPAFGGDPKPAARPSGVTRSRPQRRSNTVAVARMPAEVGVAQTPMAASSVPSESDAPRTEASRVAPRSEVGESYGLRPLRYSESTDQPPEARRSASAGARVDESGRKPANKTGSIVGMAVASLLLIAYAFEIGPLETAVDAAAGHLSFGGAGSGTAQWLGSLLPWLLALPALALFGFIVWLLAGIIGLRQTGVKRRKPKQQKAVKSPLQRFKDAALRHNVDNRTAYRGWRLLETACDESDAVTLEANLTDDLKLSPRDQRSVHLQLLSELGRVSDPAMRLPATQTVLDLLLAVQEAPQAKSAGGMQDVPLPGDPGQRRTRQRPTA